MRLDRRRFLVGAVTTLSAPALVRGAKAAAGSVNVAWIRQFAPAGVVQKGMDIARATGLNVNQVGFTRALDGLIALQKREVDLSDTLIGYTQVCLAIAQGIDITMLAGSSLGLTEILIAPKLLPAGTFDEKNKAYTGTNAWALLKGKAVGGARGSQQEYLLRYYLKEHGLDFDKDIKFVDLKTNTDQVLALRQGGIDAACVIEPTAIQARVEGYAALLAFGYDKDKITTLNSCVLARTEFIKQKPEIVQTIVDSHVKAIRLYKADPALWVKDTAAVTLFSPNVLEHLLNPGQLGLDPKYWRNLEISYELPVKRIQQFAKLLFDGGVLKKDVSADIPKHVEFSFLEKATGEKKEQLGG